MRPIAYGFLVFLTSGPNILVFSLGAMGEFGAGEVGLNTLGYYGIMAAFVLSMPAAIALEIIQWYRRRKTKVTPSPEGPA